MMDVLYKYKESFLIQRVPKPKAMTNQITTLVKTLAAVLGTIAAVG
ncbi:hypothetical protein L9W92_14895 [Pelotomaculum terephthalicicum JT]|nr:MULTISPECIES: hypothetical protein [Pelotomaculum]MCG9969308.1 hypothetical protein [Pelotomaculum terephthalicicum JT]